MGPTWGPCHLRYKYRTTMSPLFANSPQRKKDMRRPYHVSKCGWPWSIFFSYYYLWLSETRCSWTTRHLWCHKFLCFGANGVVVFPVSGCRRAPSFSLHLLVFLCRRVVRHRRGFFPVSGCRRAPSFSLTSWCLVGCDSSSSSLSPSYMYCSQLLLSSSIFLCTICRSVVRYGAWFFFRSQAVV